MGLAGLAGAETITDWLPAVLPLEQTTTTVYVPGLTDDQAADWLTEVPDSATCRPWAKLACRLVSRAAVPQLPLIWVHAAGDHRDRGAGGTDRDARDRGGRPGERGRERGGSRQGQAGSEQKSRVVHGLASGGTVGGTSDAPPRVGNVRAASTAANAAPGPRACGADPIR